MSRTFIQQRDQHCFEYLSTFSSLHFPTAEFKIQLRIFPILIKSILLDENQSFFNQRLHKEENE